MSLKNCKECGQKISTKALACPHCGNRKSTMGCLLVFFACLVCLAGLSWLGSASRDWFGSPGTEPSIEFKSPQSTSTPEGPPKSGAALLAEVMGLDEQQMAAAVDVLTRCGFGEIKAAGRQAPGKPDWQSSAEERQAKAELCKTGELSYHECTPGVQTYRLRDFELLAQASPAIVSLGEDKAIRAIHFEKEALFLEGKVVQTLQPLIVLEAEREKAKDAMRKLVAKHMGKEAAESLGRQPDSFKPQDYFLMSTLDGFLFAYRSKHRDIFVGSSVFLGEGRGGWVRVFAGFTRGGKPLYLSTATEDLWQSPAFKGWW